MEDIERLLHDAVLHGEVEIMGIAKDGDLEYGLSQKGEAHALDIAGGKDVLENTGKLLAILHKHKAMGFDVETTIGNFTLTLGIFTFCHR